MGFSWPDSHWPCRRPRSSAEQKYFSRWLSLVHEICRKQYSAKASNLSFSTLLTMHIAAMLDGFRTNLRYGDGHICRREQQAATSSSGPCAYGVRARPEHSRRTHFNWIGIRYAN